ncbi:MAG: hypothetical protein JWN25_11 [Verrucomicrobiales bacterium]|nr:hypothetical protein [Verrucomicrobiales bacterium]
MHFYKSLFLVILCLNGALASFAAPHRFLCSDYNGNKVCIVSEKGDIEWEYPCKNPQDCWKLPNGNILFCFLPGALEVTPDKKIVWEYKAPDKSEVHACQPLPNGNVMLVEGGSSRIIEVDRAGKIAREIKLTTASTVATHNQYRGTRKTSDNHYIVCFKGEGKVVELDETGKQLREVKVAGDPHGAYLLPNKNWLITCGDGHKVVEIDPSGKSVWELNENELPGNTLRLMAGAQRLPNGNTIFCNYLGHGHIGEQPMFFELTPAKEIVWQFRDDAHFKTINQVMLLDIPGDVTKGEIIR